MVQLGLRVSHFFSSAMMSFVNCVAFGTEPRLLPDRCGYCLDSADLHATRTELRATYLH